MGELDVSKLHIEDLQQQIEKYESDRQKLIKEFQGQKTKLQSDADAKLKNAHSEIFGLECKLKEAQKTKTARDIALNSEQSEMSTINAKDVEKLTKEIQSMDRIIDGLNQENAKLLKQIKEQKIDLRQSQQIMFSENQKINDNLKQTQHQLTDLQETKIEEMQPAAFNEIQKLRKQLREIKSDAAGRERELGIQIPKK